MSTPRCLPAIVLLVAAAGASHALAQEEGGMSAVSMQGLLGPYDLTREASGTSWQPDSTPMTGMHVMSASWIAMLHGYLDLVYDDQGGPRGATQTFLTGMLMFVARQI